SFVGADERALPLVRAMIASLAFNHSPDELELTLITADPDGDQWGAFKWLPHANDPTRMTADGPARRIYRTLADFADDLPDSVKQRPEFHGNDSVPNDGAERPYPHMVVFIDLPAAQVRLPEAFGVRGIDGITLLVVRAGSNELPAADDAALIIDEDGKISTAVEPALITADAMSVAEFDTFARTMGGYRSGRDISLPGLDESPKSKGRTPYLKALGIDNLETFDAYQFWSRTEGDLERVIPVGDLIDETTLLPTGQLAELSLSETSLGGSGPHGSMQGTTGTGKSYLLQPMVLSLATRYSPEQVVFILMDFKGGSTFMGYENLPHVLANITNLAKDQDVLLRAETVIRGELNKRQEIFDQHKVPDILAYNKQREKEPGLPALPELFVIIDEFGEFITENRDFLKLFSSITKVGRSLGVHLKLGSQYIDSTVVGDIQNNLNFGISLAVKSPVASRFVIGTDAAVNLKEGQGHAYLRRRGRDEGIVLIQGFEVGAPYIPAEAPVADIGVSGAGLDETTSTETALVPFTSISNSSPVTDSDGVLVAEPVITNTDQFAETRQALFDTLARFQNIQPRMLWQPTLSSPISFHGAELPTADTRGLRIRIGDLDDPHNHRRIPYTIRPERDGAHIRVIGARGTGKSTTLQTIIASAAQTYAPTQVQFYLIDFGSKLREVEHYPNVGARASSTDDEKIDRIIAEFKRIVAVRVDEFERRRVSNYAAYAESKATDPVPGDQYGEMFLVIDGVNEFLNTRQEGAQQQITERRMNTLTEIAKAGGSRGIHLMISGEMESGKIHFYNEFGLWILHSTSDPAQFTTILDREIRDKYKTVPATQPGRALEPTTGMHARVYVPQLDEIEPIPGAAPAEYDPTADYADGIRALGEQLAAQYVVQGPEGQRLEIRAPQIVTVPEVLPWGEVIWPIYQSTRTDTTPRALPLGAAADDLSLVMLPADDPRSVPHLLVVGDPQSGKTTVVRSLLRSIIQQYRPDEAQIYLFDSGYTMINESKVLDHLGMLGSYQNQPGRIETAAKAVASIIASRQPDPDTVTPEQISAGSWYTGPKIFVIIDPATTLTATGSYEAAATDPLNEAIEQQRDLGMSLGLHVFATEHANQYMSRRNGSKLYKTLTAANSDILLLSGTSTEPIAGSYNSQGGKIMFARRRPGLAQLYSPSTGHHPVLQTAWHPPFEAPTQGS
ncbi:MAG: FtsK/SpoIIIE domain-containing protein, partial [Rhodococcus sp. (in: high G+C Gram-positive bacteria)]|uniref:FtsK/SpoIIIE domain-containing protein n=1 Tax=Rhodococcus sp. TaxID=1831 RepID=UPI003BB0D125